MAPSNPDRHVETMLAEFERGYRSKVPFREDAVLGHELAVEVRPLLETLLQSAQGGASASFHEGYALLTLLGRRAGLLGATPTAALAMLDALLQAFRSVEVDVVPFAHELPMVLLEGYCAGRDERTSADLTRAVQQSQTFLSIAPRCVCVLLHGPLEPDALEAVLEEFARRCLREDARACLFDLGRLKADASERMARPILEFALSCRGLGVQMAWVGLSAELKAALEQFGMPGDIARFTSEFPEALAWVLEKAGHRLHAARRSWAASLFSKR